MVTISVRGAVKSEFDFTQPFNIIKKPIKIKLRITYLYKLSEYFHYSKVHFLIYLQLRIDKNLTQNLIPKLSKGSDIVIMEAIERELLDNDDFEFDKEAE
jgi:hypothetical protein